MSRPLRTTKTISPRGEKDRLSFVYLVENRNLVLDRVYLVSRRKKQKIDIYSIVYVFYKKYTKSVLAAFRGLFLYYFLLII